MNNELRLMITEMVKRSGEGHIPSSFSIVDIIEFLYISIYFIFSQNVWILSDILVYLNLFQQMEL